MKKDMMKKGMMVLACVYGLGSTIYFGGQYVKQKQHIEFQKEEMSEIINGAAESARQHKEETEKLLDEVSSLMLEKEAITNDLDYARHRIDVVGAEIGELEERIEKQRFSRGISRGGSYTGTGTKIMVKVTGYCPCSICCGVWASLNPGITASGTVAKYGTIAAPPSLPFGTQIQIDGYGSQVFTVEDTGNAVVYSNGVYVIDMWMPTHEQAYAVGNSIVEAIILN